MKRWSAEEDEIVRDFGSRGAARCARIIYERTGVRRSTQAVRRHGYRIGACMVRHEVCPRCGATVASLVRTSGLCRECNYRLLAEEQREESRRIKDELRRERGHEQAKREYDTARRDRQRAKRR